MKRGASGLCGVLAIDKPYGMTSHDVIDRVRRITGERRVGHAGTLDPAATGVMLVGVGAATRLSEYLIGHDKEYDARIVFGASTDTDDAQGRMLACAQNNELARIMEEADPDALLETFTGEIEQLPPAYSAIKKNGVASYKAAREGTCIELDTRNVTVYSADLKDKGVVKTSLGTGEEDVMEAELPYWDVHFHVSKGTYIRALARDLGLDLGCGAHLGALRRTAVSSLGLDQTITLDELAEYADDPSTFPWADPCSLLGFTMFELNEDSAKHLMNGQAIDTSDLLDEGLVSCVHDGRLIAVGEVKEGSCHPKTVIMGGVPGIVQQ